MKNGCLDRSFTYNVNGKSFDFKIKRFLSYDMVEVGAISYEITANNNANIKFTPYLNGNVHNEDANYDEFFWENCSQSCDNNMGSITMTTKKTGFTVHAATKSVLRKGSDVIAAPPVSIKEDDKYIEHVFETDLKAGENVALFKYFTLVTDRDHDLNDLSVYGEKKNLQMHTRLALKSFTPIIQLSGQTSGKKQTSKLTVISLHSKVFVLIFTT